MDYDLFPFWQDHDSLDFAACLDAPEVLITRVTLKPMDIFTFAMLIVEVFAGQKHFGRSAYDAVACLYIAKGSGPGARFQQWHLGPGPTSLGAGS